MSDESKKSHRDVVKIWEEKNVRGLRSDQILKIFGTAILAVEHRCLETLSQVTVEVILDRVLHEGLDKFPLLSNVTIEAGGLNLSGLDRKVENLNPEAVTETLSYLLIEFLTVVGNITSEVLSVPLHKELMKVTRETALNVLEVQNLRALNSTKKRGER